MDERPHLASVAATIADPARARMLAALMCGQAWTATELALEAGVAPSTASAHLRTLCDAGLVRRAASGRHRYFELVDGEVADVLEGLADLAAKTGRRVFGGHVDPAARAARVCYDHLAGAAGVQLFEALRASGVLVGEQVLQLAEHARRRLLDYGIDLQTASGTRPLCRRCLDWTERRPHLGGALGAALLRLMITENWVARDAGTRTVRFSADGRAHLAALVQRLRG